MATYLDSGMTGQSFCPSCSSILPLEELRVLPCLHTFCKSCLCKPSEGRTRGCFICGKGFQMDDTGVNSLPTVNSMGLDILSVVGSGFMTESTTANNVKTGLCKSCDENNLASSICINCSEYLCTNCTFLHQTMRATKDHFMVQRYASKSPPLSSTATSDINSHLSSLSLTVQPPPMLSLPVGPEDSPPPRYCLSHPGKQLTLFCKKCATSICVMCSLQTHAGHEHTYLYKAPANVEVSRVQASQLLADADTGMQYMETGVALAQRMCNQIDHTCQAVAKDIRAAAHQQHALVEEKERELVRQLETIRQVKSQYLHMSIDTLNSGMRSLSTAVSNCEFQLGMAGSASSSSATGNGHHPGQLLDSVAALKKEMENIKRIHHFFKPLEDDNIHYVPTDPMLFQQISLLGTLNTTAFAPKCIAAGEGVVRGIRGTPARFSVITHDHTGAKQQIGGENVEVIVTPSGGGPSFPADILDQKNGVYAVSFSPNIDGYHDIAVTIRGNHIKNSPFRCLVKTGRDYAAIMKPLFTFGSEGDSDGQVCRPWGVCCDREGNILVADRSNNRIQVFSGVGKFLFKFGVSGSGPGQFDRPAGIAVTGQNHIVISDKDNHRIQMFTHSGMFLRQFGEKGSKNGQFNYPWDVCVNRDDYILVSDTRNHRVQLFNPEGIFVNKYGFDGNLWKHFDSPRGVTFNHENHAVVTDFNNHRLLVISPDLQTAHFLGCEGSANGQFMRPQGVAVDEEGYILVADSRNNRIQIFHPSGNFCHKIEGLSGASVQMDRPSGICLTPDGKVVVVDFGNHRIIVY